jgi:hypothetical protein
MQALIGFVLLHKNTENVEEKLPLEENTEDL